MVAATVRPTSCLTATTARMEEARAMHGEPLPDAYLLHPRPPFSFGQALAFLRRFPPTQGERVVLEDAVLGAARVDGRTFGFRIEEAGSVEAPALRCVLGVSEMVGEPASGPPGPSAAEGGTLDSATVDAVLTRIGHWLGIDDDLVPFYALAEADPPFRAVIQRMYGYHQVRFFTPFENTVWAILGQRTPFGVARAAKRRLMEGFGGGAEVEGHTILGFPEPDDLAGADRAELAGLVGSERKADRLLTISRAFAETGPPVLRAMPTADLGAWLQALPGIGPWSVAFILLRGFGRRDTPLPLGSVEAFDRELLQAGRAVYGPDVTVAHLAEIAARYGSERGAWGHYLRVAG